MIIPTILGSVPTNSPFIYAAGDAVYFEIHGKPLVNSILKNTDYNVHIHIYNPTVNQLQWLHRDRVTCSYEHLSADTFNSITKDWLKRTTFNNHREKQMYDKGQMFGKDFLQDLIQKTYYACCRFIRLSEIMPVNSRCLAIDIDGIVRSNFPIVLNNEEHDFYLYKKKTNEHLAGAILFTERSRKFLKDYANNICHHIEKDDIYWFMDQVELDKCVFKHNAGILPMSYIDWEMSPYSNIWSAKGKRKDTIIFQDEQKKYNY